MSASHSAVRIDGQTDGQRERPETLVSLTYCMYRSLLRRHWHHRTRSLTVLSVPIIKCGRVDLVVV